MEKIRLGRTNLTVARIGFGGIPIQLPTENEAIKSIRSSLNLGIDFIDTAYMYGTSEERIGKALSRRSNKPIIATKVGSANSEIEGHLNSSLKLLKIESIDLYQFHNVSNFDTLKSILAPWGALSLLKKAKKAGKIKHIGITSHQLDVAIAAVKSEQFETIMYPFNFVANEAENELLKLAEKYDMGFIAMKPFAGGRIKNIKVAIKYLLQFPNVLILPGIADFKQAEEIVNILKSPGMTMRERQEMRHIKEKLDNRICRHCDYCMPCPQGIHLSSALDFEAMTMSFPEDLFYAGPMSGAISMAARCDDCGQCEDKCPYHISVRVLLREYVENYNAGKKRYLSRKAAER